MIEKLKAALSGKKSTALGVGTVALGIGLLAGWVQIDQEQLAQLGLILGGAATVFLRAGLAKLGEASAEKAAAE